MNYKKTVKTFHDTGWKNSYHTSDHVSMLGFGYSVSQYPQFFVKDLDIYQMLPHPYLRSFDVCCGDKLKNNWVINLENRAETFVWKCIESRIMSDDQGKIYKSILENFEKKLEKAKEILPSTCRIGETIFTSMAVIGGKLYSNHPINLNHVHKDSTKKISVIITVVNYISGGDTVFYDRVKKSYLGNRSHILKHLHGRMIFGTFEKVYHEGTLWSGYRAVISFILTKQIFLHFFCHGDQFYNRYINTADKKTPL